MLRVAMPAAISVTPIHSAVTARTMNSHFDPGEARER